MKHDINHSKKYSLSGRPTEKDFRTLEIPQWDSDNNKIEDWKGFLTKQSVSELRKCF